MREVFVLLAHLLIEVVGKACGRPGGPYAVVADLDWYR